MSDRPALLVVAHRVPYPPDKGDRIRSYHLLKHLSRKARVHLATLADEPVPDEVRHHLESLCERVFIAPLTLTRWLRGLGSVALGRSITEGAFRSPAVARQIQAWAAEKKYHAALATSSGVASYLQRGNLANVPAVVDLVDVDSRKWSDYSAVAGFPKSWIYRLEGKRLAKAERKIAGWARATTLVSEAEAELFRESAPETRPIAVTNGVDLDYFRPQECENGGLVFVGAFDYRPNVDAAVWFAKNVWPEVRERHPGLQWKIVGRNPSPAVRELAQLPGIEVTGAVADVRPYVHEAAIAIAPLRIARGLQNKVLEALALGKAVISSPPGLAGFRADIPAIAAREPREWIIAFDWLLNDANERSRLGQAGRRFAEAYHDWDRCLQPFDELLGLA